MRSTGRAPAPLRGCFPSAEPGRWTGENSRRKKRPRHTRMNLITGRRLLVFHGATCFDPGGVSAERDNARGTTLRDPCVPLACANPAANPLQARAIKSRRWVLLGSGSPVRFNRPVGSGTAKERQYLLEKSLTEELLTPPPAHPGLLRNPDKLQLPHWQNTEMSVKFPPMSLRDLPPSSPSELFHHSAGTGFYRFYCL